MNIKEIKEMINLMNENGLMELEVEKEGMRIRLKKTGTGAEAYASPVVLERQRVDSVSKDEANQVREADSKSVEIRSPMVGTFYRAPSPESAPYVEVGQVVEPGQVICIIEAMKLMNEIKSEVKGKIIEVLVDNAEPIEFGQPIFLIEPV